MIKNIVNREPIPIYGDGKNIRDWIHVQDHCEAIDVVLHKGKDGEIYNIGGETERRNIDIAYDMCTILGYEGDMIEFVKDRKGHDWRYAMDISKIRNELGWSPKIKFEDGLKELLDESSNSRKS